MMHISKLFFTGILSAGVLLPFAAGAAPVADAGLDQTVLDREGDGVETVVLDGSAGTGTITAWEWKNGDTVLTNGIRCLATLPVGTNTVTLTVTDDQAQTAADTLQVVIRPLSGPKQRRNLKDKPVADRFAPPTDLFWPAAAGEAGICLWKDDLFAAFSLVVDDNCVPNHDWWVDICNQHGWKMTWFVVTSSVTNNPGFSGPWSAFQRLADLGHDIQSHSVSHYSDGATRTDAELIVQYRDAIAAMEANLTGVRVTTIAWPYGSYKRDPGAMFHIAGRGVSAVSRPARTDYMEVGATSSGINPAYVDATLYGTSSISWLNNSGNLRGWGCGLYHYISDTSQKAAEVEYLASKTNLWVGTFTEVAKYGQERDTAVLTVLTNSADGVRFTISDEMDDTLFDYPLTVKVKMHPGWLGVQATQNGTPIASEVVSYNGALYALVQAVPDQGVVVLSKAASASFSVSPSSGWAPLTVTFADTSILNGISNRFWNFGDGFTTNTAAADISHTYTSNGTNTVTLIVSSPDGIYTNSQTAAVVAIVPTAPSAGFTVSPSSGNVPLAVTFTDSSTGSITNRYWNFGDGSTTNTTLLSVVHTYTAAGTNTVQLIVSGPLGSSTNTQIAAVTVTPPALPSASFTALPTSGFTPLTVTFTDTSTGSITNRFWIFGDGATTNTIATSVSHTYTSAGTLTVQLIVSGPAGAATNTQTGLITVTAAVLPGSLIVYDPFNDAVTSTTASSNTIPTGWFSDSVTNSSALHGTVASNSLSYSGLADSQRNSFRMGNKTADYYMDFTSPNLTNAGQTVYFSLLMRLNSATPATMNSGYFRLFDSGDASGSGITVGLGVTNLGGGLSFAINNRNYIWNNAASIKTPPAYAATGTTHLIVASYTRGAAAATGATKLWVNPDRATFGSLTPPSATVETNSYAADSTWNRLQIKSDGSGSWPVNWQVDEVRIGTDWASVVPSNISAPNGDANDNGIPDSWESQYGITNSNPNALAANGVNTILEAYVAGLNPTNSEKFLSSVLCPPSSGSILQWSAASGRVYSVYWTTNLLGGFQPLETNILWPQNSWTDTVHGAQGEGFYRIKVQLEN
jgi:PKD repeat protein